MVSLLKRNNCYKATQHTRTLMEIMGGNAAADEYHIGRIASNLHTVSTYEGALSALLSSSIFASLLTDYCGIVQVLTISMD